MKLENLGNDIQLLPTEEIVGEWDTILLTNMRLAVSKKPGITDSGWEQALLEECLDPELKNAGKLSRKWLGYRLLSIGLVLIGPRVVTCVRVGHAGKTWYARCPFITRQSNESWRIRKHSCKKVAQHIFILG